MSVDSRLADRLIPFANNEALSVLFKYSDELPLNDTQNVSSELVLSRWPKLSAVAASNVARCLKDPNLIDKICEKEKRKSVRLALASNPNTSEPTLLFLLQEALRNTDWEITTRVLDSFNDDVILEMVINDQALDHRTYSRRAVKALVNTSKSELVRAYLAKVDRPSYIVSQMLEEDFEKAYNILLEIEYDLKKVDWQRVRIRDCESIEILRSLYDNTSKDSGLVDLLLYLYQDEPKKLAEINVSLLKELLKERSVHITAEHVTVFQEHGLISELIKNQRSRSSIDKEVAEGIDLSLLDKDAKVVLSLIHPDPSKAASLVGDKEDYLRAFSTNDSRTMQANWVNKVIPYLPLSKSIDLIESISSKGLGVMTLESFAETLKVDMEEFLRLVSDQILKNLDSLPSTLPVSAVIENVISRGDEAKTKAYGLLLRNFELNDSEFTEVISYLIKGNNSDLIAEWLPNASEDKVRILKEIDKDLLLESFHKIQSSRRHSITWYNEVITLIAPTQGWGSVVLQSRSASEAAMRYLTSNVTNPSHWEIVLGMFSAWTGTLEQLLHFAKKV
jgi:SHS2 domain-containing protein